MEIINKEETFNETTDRLFQEKLFEIGEVIRRGERNVLVNPITYPEVGWEMRQIVISELLGRIYDRDARVAILKATQTYAH